MKRMLVGMIAALSLCGGCMTHTVTRLSGSGSQDGQTVHSRTIWIWQRDFWKHK